MKNKSFRSIKKTATYVLLAFTLILFVSCKKDTKDADTTTDNEGTDEVPLATSETVIVDKDGNVVATGESVGGEGDGNSGNDNNSSNSNNGNLAYQSDVERRTTDTNVLNPTETTTDNTTIKEHDPAQTLSTNALSFKVGTAKWTAARYNIQPLSEQHDLLEVTLTIKNTANKAVIVTREDIIASYLVDGQYYAWFNTLLTSKYNLNSQFPDSFELQPGKSLSGSLFFEFPKDIDSVTLHYTELYGTFTTPPEYEMIIPIQ